MKKIHVFVLLISLCSNYFGQITTSVNPSIAAMQAILQGNGVVVTGLTITCPNNAYATFGNGAAALGGGLSSGLLLTTGNASNVSGPNTAGNNLSFDNFASGSTVGDNLSGGATYDGCYINFMLTPSCATLSINYVFASEEYPEYSVGSINDVFGFVITGTNPSGTNYNQTNIATLPGTTTPVSIQNVNNGMFNTGPCKNCAYYVPTPPGLAYDGCTTVLTASCLVVPCQTYTMTIGVWDDSDHIYDSGVFLDVNGLSCANQPTLVATINPTTTCGAQTVTLTVSGGFSIGSYTWSAPASGGLTSTLGPVVVANPTAPTTYTVTYTDINTCPGFPVTQTVALNFSAPSTFPVSQSPLGTICSGSTVTLTASGGAGTYSWSPSTSLSTVSSSITMASPTITTTYTVTKTVGVCVSSAIITVTVVPASSVSVTPLTSIVCSGQSQTLAASGLGTFAWGSSAGIIPSTAASVTVTPLSTTTYTVISGVGTCSSSAVATVSVLPSATIAITPASTSVCLGQSAVLSSSGSGPFVWSASSGIAPPGTATIAVSPSITTTYTVLSGIGSCTSQAVATVNVLPAINPTIFSATSFVCLSSTVSLSVVPSVGLTYTWQPSNSISGAVNTSTIIAMPPSTSTVIYTVTVSNGLCSSSDTIQLKVNSPPNIKSVTTLNNDTICLGGCVTFSANTTGSVPILYKWYYESGIGTSTVGVAPEACYPNAGTFSIVATASNGCGFDTLRKPNFVTVYNIPALIVRGDTTINIGETATISASGALSYNWSPNVNGTIACPTCSNTVVQPTITTQYIVTATNSKYCKVQDTVTVKVDVNCGDFFVPNVFSPNDDGLNDLINVHGRCISTYNLQIFNRWGEKIFETSSLENSWDGTFKGKRLDTGVFVYRADGVSIDGQSFRMQGNITLIR